MGIAPDIQYGHDCLACWPPFLTPKFLWVTFADIILSPDPPCDTLTTANVTVKLTQLNACFWFGITGHIWASFTTNIPGSRLAATWEQVFAAFDSFDPADCIFAHANQLPGPPDTCYSGGFGQVTW